MFQDVRALWPPRSTWNMLATKQRRFERRRCCIGKKHINHITSCGTCRQARVASCEFQGKKNTARLRNFQSMFRDINQNHYFFILVLMELESKTTIIFYSKIFSLEHFHFCPNFFTLDSQVVLAPPFDTHHGRCCWAGILQTSRSLARHLFEGG